MYIEIKFNTEQFLFKIQIINNSEKRENRRTTFKRTLSYVYQSHESNFGALLVIEYLKYR